MPELPEVETIRRDLEKSLIGCEILRIKIFDGRIINHSNPRYFKKNLIGKTIQGFQRRGKALVFLLSNETYLVVHLKMTGQLILGEKTSLDRRSKDTKLTFELSKGKILNYNDQRLFGWLQYVEKLEEISFIQQLGVDPFHKTFNEQWLGSQIRRRKAPIKSLLMNQHFIAGIGNIYASEILFDAHIHPKKSATNLSAQERKNLISSTTDILSAAIKCRGTSLRNYRDSVGAKGQFINRIKVYGREGEDCPKCKTAIIRIVQNGRSTFYCERCQK